MLLFLLPFLGFMLNFFSRFIGKKASISLSIGSVFLTFLYALYTSFEIFNGKTITYTWNWLLIGPLDLKFSFLLDSLSISMSLLITFITTLVMIYSSKYLEEDPSIVRFLSFFALFDVCMLLTATSGNYIQFFLGWEGVGLTSFLLISFWHTRTEANKGALKAVVVNRIGDVFFMLALALMWLMFKSFDYATIFSIYPEYIANTIPPYNQIWSLNVENLLAFFILLAASAKSAQFLLSVWLPDAMEGPTPVSSLLHSATMVTLGIYLIIRSSTIFAQNHAISLIMTIFGVITAIISGLIGLAQYDLKRIIAYSTCSQLGFMTMACGLGYYSYALFHLITHAFFKCLLFLCSGSIIHAVNDEQDIRRYGGLFFYIPITATTMTIGTITITGFPFLSGYYSKDLILETAYNTAQVGFAIYILATIAAFLTSFYSLRAIYFVFFGKTSSLKKSTIKSIHESSPQMTGPMITLAIFAIFSGYFLKDILTGPTGAIVWGNAIPSALHASFTEHEYIPLLIKILPTILAVLGLILSYLYFHSAKCYSTMLTLYSTMNLTSQKFYLDQIHNLIISKSTTSFGYIQYTLFDRGYLEKMGPNGIIETIHFLQKKLNFQSGLITHYLIICFTSIFLIIFSYYLHLSWALTAVALVTTLFIPTKK